MKKIHVIVAVACFCLVCAFTVNAQQEGNSDAMIEYFKTPRPMALPFSGATRVGNILYLSGEIGVDYKTMKVVAGGIQAETNRRWTISRLPSRNTGLPWTTFS